MATDGYLVIVDFRKVSIEKSNHFVLINQSINMQFYSDLSPLSNKIHDSPARETRLLILKEKSIPSVFFQ